MGVKLRRDRIWLSIERAAWVFGLVALAIWSAVTVAGLVGARHDLERFEVLREQPVTLRATATPDLSLWNRGRLRAWRTALTQPAPPPLAILRIPTLHIEVAVLPGTDEFVLNRAVGHIEDTALPGNNGNAGIAGHRDSFFRGLNDVALGDAIELETLEGLQMYHVERISIVDPADVSVLDPTPVRSLTLVTCYPFYFIGSAPQRFIVRAVRTDADTTSASFSGRLKTFN